MRARATEVLSSDYAAQCALFCDEIVSGCNLVAGARSALALDRGNNERTNGRSGGGARGLGIGLKWDCWVWMGCPDFQGLRGLCMVR